jgi:tetratricopeptide (TPR) repeat protein
MNKLQTFISLILIVIFALQANIAGAESDAIRRILINGIEVNFSGDYDRAAEIFSTIDKEDPNHPSQSFYQAVVLFWKISVAEGSPLIINSIRQHLNKAIEQSEDILKADENDPDALHYLGLAYTYLGRLEAQSGNMYKGGVLGERGRKYLERAIEICEQENCSENKPETEPETEPDAARCRPCEDLYFPLGAYSYFAGRLPQFLQAINFLWFIPSGSTEEGLNAIERSYTRSDLHRPGAQSLLASIFLSFEINRIDDARKLSDDLVRRFPDNPYLEIQHADILMASGQNQAAAENARKIIEKADHGLRSYDAIVRQRALLVKAEAAIRQGNTSAAREILAQLKNNPTFQNNSLAPHTDLLLGMQADVEMKREKAIGYYEKAESYEGTIRNRIVARKARQYLKEPFTNSDRGFKKYH